MPHLFETHASPTPPPHTHQDSTVESITGQTFTHPLHHTQLYRALSRSAYPAARVLNTTR